MRISDWSSDVCSSDLLRKLLQPLADIEATTQGFRIVAPRERSLVVLAQPFDETHAAVLALLADGEAWASSALALALGSSQRSTQRALDALAARGKVQAFGRGRARRWLTPDRKSTRLNSSH